MSGVIMTENGLKLSPLDDLHHRYGARMVPFAGYSMPLQYKAGVKKEHVHTRTKAGLFDVSHMGQIRLKGDSIKLKMESLVPSDIQSLKDGNMRYTVFTNDKGGVLDDLIVTNAGDHIFVVVNAACRGRDIDLMRANLRCDIEELDDYALLALQGPLSQLILESIAPGVKDLKFMMAGNFFICGVPSFVTRSGYTGEDGYEISIPANKALEVAEAILSYKDAELIGLGARDSLRLEAGLCLYGNDLDATISPIEAGLSWVIGKRRREDGGFPGYEIITQQLRNGVWRRRVGIKPNGRAPARERTEIVDGNGIGIGAISSGGFSPTIEGPIAMGYINNEYSFSGSKVSVVVRGNALPAKVVDLPFVTPNYKRI
jgi:aminomethyltransferase